MKKAFTLIELVIVGTVIAILIVIGLPLFRGTTTAGDITQAKSDLSMLQIVVENYHLQNNNVYPRTLDDLIAEAQAHPLRSMRVPSRRDPFGKADKWGNFPNYVYFRGGTNDQFYVIYSVGPDGNGSAWIDSGTNTVVERNGESCIFVSNASPRDTRP